MPGSPDEDFDRIQRGASAGYFLAEITRRVQDREAQLMNSAIARWRAGTLTGDDARAAIAAIAELRGILSDLAREARQGQEASQRLLAAAVWSAPPPGSSDGAT